VTDKQKLFWLLVVVGVGVVGVVIWRTRDPLDGQGPDVMAYLTEEKTLCESMAQQLQAKGIDGSAEYDKVQAADHACIGYLVGVVDQGSGDQQKMQERFSRLRTESINFRTWAMQQLHQYGAGEDKIDPVAMVAAALKQLVGQEEARRKAVKETLEKCKLRSWEEIRSGK
jgi:hypothetical protein